jgi:AraC-like DNA-binding protein
MDPGRTDPYASPMTGAGLRAAGRSPSRRALFSTRAISPERRHREWSKIGDPPMGEVFSARADDDFTAEVEAITIGHVSLMFGWYGAQSIARGEDQIRRHPLDVICLTIAGTMSLTGPAYTIEPGCVGIIDFSKPFAHHSSAGSLTSVIIPHALAAAAGIDVAALHGMVFSNGQSAMLRNFVGALRLIIEHVPQPEEERVVRSILDTLALTLVSMRGEPDRLSKPEMSLKARAEHLIASQQDIDAINASDLGKALGISRTRLYALYRDEGGVTARLQRERLERARIALEVSDLPVGEIGYRFGFRQAAHFSRLFKHTYGKSPRSWRASPNQDQGR